MSGGDIGLENEAKIVNENERGQTSSAVLEKENKKPKRSDDSTTPGLYKDNAIDFSVFHSIFFKFQLGQ